MSSIRKLFGKSDSTEKSEQRNGFFSKRDDVDFLDKTIKTFTTAEYCFSHIHTLLNVHRSRLTTKIEDQEKFIAKVPGAGALFNFGTKPTPQQLHDKTIALLKLVVRNKKIPLAEELNDFRLEWDKQKKFLQLACDLDMPFSDAAKQGKRVVNRIDKLLLKIDSFLKIDTKSDDIDRIITPPGAPYTPPHNGSEPPPYDATPAQATTSALRRSTF